MLWNLWIVVKFDLEAKIGKNSRFFAQNQQNELNLLSHFCKNVIVNFSNFQPTFLREFYSKWIHSRCKTHLHTFNFSFLKKSQAEISTRPVEYSIKMLYSNKNRQKKSKNHFFQKFSNIDFRCKVDLRKHFWFRFTS